MFCKLCNNMCYLLRYAVVEQDCVKFSRQTERREHTGISVWHPISTHLTLITAGHLLPLIIWGLYKHTHTQRERVNIPSYYPLPRLLWYKHRNLSSNPEYSCLPPSTCSPTNNTNSPSEQHMLTMISRDVCCADISALASRNSSLSLLKPQHTHTTKPQK